jgi:hypothetical protein
MDAVKGKKPVSRDNIGMTRLTRVEAGVGEMNPRKSSMYGYLVFYSRKYGFRTDFPCDSFERRAEGY